MLYRLCKNIYRLHVVFVFLTSFSIYNYNRGPIKILNKSFKKNKAEDPSCYHNPPPNPL